MASDYGKYYRHGDNPHFAVGSKVTNQELIQEASRLRQHQILNSWYGNNGGQVLRYRIKKAHPDQQPALGSAHEMRSSNPTEPQQLQQQGDSRDQASSGDDTLVKGGAKNDKNRVDDSNRDDEYEYFYATPGSLRDKILLEDYGAAVFPQPKKTWKLWSLDLGPPRPPLPKPENFLSPKKRTEDRDTVPLNLV